VDTVASAAAERERAHKLVEILEAQINPAPAAADATEAAAAAPVE
jgi:hypothetical protein